MYSDRIRINVIKGKVHFSVVSNETKVDTFLLSIEDARVVLTNNTEEWVKSGNISQKFSGNTYKITIYVSETHFVHLQVRSQDYNPAVAEFLSQIGGL